MPDISSSFDLDAFSERLKEIREARSKQYKDAKKYLEDISKTCDKNSEELRNAETYFKKYERFKVCTTQEALAEAINVKRQTIVDWEKGHTPPSVANLVRLCSAFDCNMDYLFSSIETPLTEPVSIAHHFSKIDSSIIKYGLENEDYLDCLNYFMRPEYCAPLFNQITISAWREYQKNSALDNLNSPLKEKIISIYDEYSAVTPIQEISKATYRKYLNKKLPKEELCLIKTHKENGYTIKKSFKPIIYQNFFEGKDFNYSSFIEYLVDNTFESLSQRKLIEIKKNILAKKFIELFEKYLDE